MSDIKCKFCGTYNKDNRQKCSNCNAPLPKRSNLSKKDETALTNYIVSIEKTLSGAEDNADKKIIKVFVILSALWISLSISLYFLFGKNHVFLFILTVIIIAIILILLWGGLINRYQAEFIEKKFNETIKYEIKEYLEQLHFTEADFKITANKNIESCPLVNKYLSYI